MASRQLDIAVDFELEVDALDIESCLGRQGFVTFEFPAGDPFANRFFDFALRRDADFLQEFGAGWC